jgi:predicted MFS family arabinose efflux permease
MRVEARHVIAILSVIVFLGGIYTKFLYDVPDAQEVTNTWVSWFLIILGVVGLALSLLWKKRRNPLIVEGDARGVVK